MVRESPPDRPRVAAGNAFDGIGVHARRETRLADAAGTGERRQALADEFARQRDQFGRATDGVRCDGRL
jgi:hypothetical protein